MLKSQQIQCYLFGLLQTSNTYVLQGSGSIYTQEMSRAERYQTYQKSGKFCLDR